LVAASGLVSALVGAPGSGGVLLGGAVIGASVFLYAAGLGAVVRRGNARLAIAILSVKLLLFLALGWFAFHAGRHRPDPIGFALGVSCLPVAAVWEALRTRGET
jgi:predicted permease